MSLEEIFTIFSLHRARDKMSGGTPRKLLLLIFNVSSLIFSSFSLAIFEKKAVKASVEMSEFLTDNPSSFPTDSTKHSEESEERSLRPILRYFSAGSFSEFIIRKMASSCVGSRHVDGILTCWNLNERFSINLGKCDFLAFLEIFILSSDWHHSSLIRLSDRISGGRKERSRPPDTLIFPAFRWEHVERKRNNSRTAHGETADLWMLIRPTRVVRSDWTRLETFWSVTLILAQRQNSRLVRRDSQVLKLNRHWGRGRDRVTRWTWTQALPLSDHWAPGSRLSSGGPAQCLIFSQRCLSSSLQPTTTVSYHSLGNKFYRIDQRNRISLRTKQKN